MEVQINPDGRLRLAVQKNGRMTEDSFLLLRSSGLDFDITGRSLFSPCNNFPLDILSVRDDDIPEYVQDGVSDLGIVGENTANEKRASVTVLERLGFAKCRLTICVGKKSKIRKLKDLNGKRIATSYPKILHRFLHAEGISGEIIEISGSIELAPALNVADATCDLVSTGTTARLNGLEPAFTVMESEAVLIGNPLSLKSSDRKEQIQKLLFRIRSSLMARRKKYVMMNAPASAVGNLRKLVPGMKSPTVVPLADSSMVAIHSVVSEEVFWDVIEQLKKSGASDIVVVPIEKVIL